jgi:large subunit ribosomal protein L10
MAHVAKWKYEEVKTLTDLLTKNKIVGMVNIGGIPGPQLQEMRHNLHGTAEIRSAKNNLILISLKEAEKQVKGIENLKDHIKGQTAIISTEINPFKLYSKLKSTRTMAPAKGGETASYDIEVKAGDTPFKPGPIVGELQKVGIPAAIEQGKVVIKKDKVLIPKGEKISSDLAKMLTRLEIFPIEIGMALNGVFEDGTIYGPDVLDIDVDEFLGRMKLASSNAFNLAINASWYNKLTIQPLISKAHNDALSVAVNQGIVNKNTIQNLISKANAQMLALKNKVS